MSRLARLFRGEAGPPIVPSSGWSAWLTTMAASAMSFLAVLTLAAGIAAERLAAEWRTDLAGVATVRVAAGDPEAPARLAAVLEVLRTTTGVRSVRVLDAAEQAALLAPWLGDAALVADLPTPALIDVGLDGDGPDPAKIQARLDLTVTGATYDDHQAWRTPLARAAAGLERLAWLATLLVVLAAAGMVALAARASLAGNVEVVRVIRLIGGEDRFIIRAFVRRLAARAAIGGLIGAAFGVAALELMPQLSIDTAVDVTLGPGRLGAALMLVGIPGTAAAIAWITARTSVRLALGRMV